MCNMSKKSKGVNINLIAKPKSKKVNLATTKEKGFSPQLQVVYNFNFSIHFFFHDDMCYIFINLPESEKGK